MYYQLCERVMLTLLLLPERMAVHRFSVETPIPTELFTQPFITITKTDEELSIVAPESVALNSDQCEGGWVMLKVEGPLDFSLTGILAGIATTLANVSVSIFAISTFDTDYILIKQGQIERAIQALRDASYQITT